MKITDMTKVVEPTEIKVGQVFRYGSCFYLRIKGNERYDYNVVDLQSFVSFHLDLANCRHQMHVFSDAELILK